MGDSRKKLTIYLHPNDYVSDSYAVDVIDKTSLRTRGDFFRMVLISGIALYQLDKRIPTLIATMFEGTLDVNTLVETIKMTTGWKPATGEIEEVIEILNCHSVTQKKDGNDTQCESEAMAIKEIRDKMKNIL